MNINFFGIKIANKKRKIIKNKFWLSYLKNNKFYGNHPKMKNSKIVFSGKNNILCCEKGVVLKNTIIEFKGDNSLIYLRKGVYDCELWCFNDGVIFIGENNYFNGAFNKHVTAICAEGKNIIIGENNMFSFDIFIRTSDAHIIYDIDKKFRINDAKSVVIGDNNWFGQASYILKGAQITNNCILGINSLVSNKKIQPNTIAAGSPAKEIKNNCSWIRKSTNKMTKTDLDNFIIEENIIEKSNSGILYEDLDIQLKEKNFAEEKYKLISNIFS